MEDNKQAAFAAKLSETLRMAREQQGVISQEQLQEAFADFDLNDTQMDQVKDYLTKHNVGIGEPADPFDYLTEEETNYLELYLESLEALPEYSQGEKEAFTISAMAGERDAQDKLIEIYLKMIPDIAKLYAEQGVYLEDLIGEGNIALTTGVTMLDAVEKSDEVEGFLTKMIMDSMEDAIAESLDQDAREVAAVKKVQEIADKAAELAEELRRKVTVEELVQEYKLEESDVLEAIRLSGNNIPDIDYKE